MIVFQSMENCRQNKKTHRIQDVIPSSQLEEICHLYFIAFRLDLELFQHHSF